MLAANYPAPALEKGLEILTLLAGHPEPMSPGEIATALNRSKAEIYRMLVTLESHAFIRKAREGRGYEITEKLFDLGIRHPPRQQLIEAALPHMRNLARETEQSCHLTVVSGDSITVVARAESDVSAGFSVKVGYRVSAACATSGRVIYAFQSRAQQAAWLKGMRGQYGRAELRSFLDDASEARIKGCLMRSSFYTRGIIDMVAPVFQGQSTTAVAALIVPFLTHLQNYVAHEAVFERLQATARLISHDVY